MNFKIVHFILSPDVRDNNILIKNFGSLSSIDDETSLISLLNKHKYEQTDYKIKFTKIRNHIIKYYSLVIMVKNYLKIYKPVDKN